MPVTASSLRWCLTAFLVGNFVSGLHAQDTVTMAPVLVSTEGGGPQWETIKQLSAAAEDGIAAACFQYAQLLENGDQVDANPKLALTYYRKAAVQDYPEAVFRLGKIAHDALLGESQNFAKALEFYRRAAALGIAEGTYNVGAMNVSGRGTKRNYVEGLAWLLLAAEQGSDPNDAVAAVKKRLKSRPDYIARAVTRLTALKAELTATAPKADPKPLAPTAPAPPLVSPPPPAQISISPTRPSFIPSAPSIGIPTIAIPKPEPKPTPPPEEP
jgi:hypothetical protein